MNVRFKHQTIEFFVIKNRIERKSTALGAITHQPPDQTYNLESPGWLAVMACYYCKGASIPKRADCIRMTSFAMTHVVSVVTVSLKIEEIGR